MYLFQTFYTSLIHKHLATNIIILNHNGSHKVIIEWQ